MEVAAKDIREMMSQQPNSLVGVEGDVHRTKTRSIPWLRKDKAYYRCRNPNHLAPACWHRETVCSACRKKGHIASVCRSRCQLAQQAAATGEIKYVSEQSDAGKEQQEWIVLTLNC